MNGRHVGTATTTLPTNLYALFSKKHCHLNICFINYRYICLSQLIDTVNTGCL